MSDVYLFIFALTYYYTYICIITQKNLFTPLMTTLFFQLIKVWKTKASLDEEVFIPWLVSPCREHNESGCHLLLHCERAWIIWNNHFGLLSRIGSMQNLFVGLRGYFA